MLSALEEDTPIKRGALCKVSFPAMSLCEKQFMKDCNPRMRQKLTDLKSKSEFLKSENLADRKQPTTRQERKRISGYLATSSRQMEQFLAYQTKAFGRPRWLSKSPFPPSKNCRCCRRVSGVNRLLSRCKSDRVAIMGMRL